MEAPSSARNASREVAFGDIELRENCADSCTEPLQARIATFWNISSEGRAVDAKAGQSLAFCRVCLEEDYLKDLCQPCVCTGSMSHAHPLCIQHWINEKGDMLCEICKQPYKGSFEQPPPPPPPRPQQQTTRVPAFRGFLLPADPETGTFTRRAFHEESAEFEQERASATWCLAAVLIFIMLLLVRHVFEVFSGPGYPDSGKPSKVIVNTPEFTDGGVTFSWGSMNGSNFGPLLQPNDSAIAPGQTGPGDSNGPESMSAWLLVAWLLLRFSAVAIPALLAYCLMASLQETREDEATDAAHAAMLWNLEAGDAGTDSAASSPRQGGLQTILADSDDDDTSSLVVGRAANGRDPSMVHASRPGSLTDLRSSSSV